MMNSVIQPLREWLAKCNSFSKSFIRQNALPLISSVLLFILVILFFFDRTVISIQSGQRGVLWRWLGAGTVIDTVYPEGVHLILPFNKMFIYNIRKQQFSDSIDVLTVDGLTVNVKYTVRYYLEPSSLPLLHQFVGPDFVNVAIRPDVRAVVRTLFGQYKPEEIYTSQKAIQLLFSEKSKFILPHALSRLTMSPLNRLRFPQASPKLLKKKWFSSSAKGSMSTASRLPKKRLIGYRLNPKEFESITRR